MPKCDFEKVAKILDLDLDLLKLNFIEITLRHGVLLQICCIVSRHLFLRSSLKGCL